jgi:hypothetical protein
MLVVIFLPYTKVKTYHQGAKLVYIRMLQIIYHRKNSAYNSTKAGVPFPMRESKLSAFNSSTLDCNSAAVADTNSAERENSREDIEMRIVEEGSK